MHLIRHGESEFNAAASSSKSWEDPQIFNPNLTAKGQAQVRACVHFRVQGRGCLLAALVSA